MKKKKEEPLQIYLRMLFVDKDFKVSSSIDSLKDIKK